MSIKERISRFSLLPSGRLGGGLSHSFALIRADKLFSTIYIAGTAVAIASAMVIAIVLNMLLADIAPEVNRSRTLYLFGSFFTESVTAKGESPHIGLSSLALDSCFRQMNCVEAAMGDGSNTYYRFPASDERYLDRDPCYLSELKLHQKARGFTPYPGRRAPPDHCRRSASPATPARKACCSVRPRSPLDRCSDPKDQAAWSCYDP